MTGKLRHILPLGVVGLLFFISPARAETLSDVALVHRCYAHLTGARMPLNHSVLAQVKAGTLSGVDACDLLVDRVMLNQQGYVTSIDPEVQKDAEAALNHIQAQNIAKIGALDFSVTLPDAGQFDLGNTEIMDSTVTALIMTEALLNPNRSYSDIFKISRVPRGERELSDSSKFVQYSPVLARGGMINTPGNGFNPATSKYKEPGYLDQLIFPDLSINTTTLKFNIINMSAATTSLGIDNNLDYPDTYVPTTSRIKIGRLKGIVYDSNYNLRFPSSATKDYYYRSADGAVLPATDLRRTIDKKYGDPEGQGGGIFATQEYLMLNFGWSYHFRADGVVSMPRRWSQSLLKDFLCRSVPVIRESDAKPFLLSGSTTYTEDQLKTAGPFRFASNCTACHATMDRLAGVVRNVSWRLPTFTNDNNAPGSTISLYTHIQAATQVGDNSPWRDIPLATTSTDTKFHLKPPIGHLAMRSYDGRFYNIPLTGIVDLGSKIADLDDTYVCAVKQYFKQFTNIDVSLHDVGDPANSSVNKGMSEADWEARDFVIQQGLQLKQHQKMSLVVKEIFKSKYFREKNIVRTDKGAE